MTFKNNLLYAFMCPAVLFHNRKMILPTCPTAQANLQSNHLTFDMFSTFTISDIRLKNSITFQPTPDYFLFCLISLEILCGYNLRSCKISQQNNLEEVFLKLQFILLPLKIRLTRSWGEQVGLSLMRVV